MNVLFFGIVIVVLTVVAFHLYTKLCGKAALAFLAVGYLACVVGLALLFFKPVHLILPGVLIVLLLGGIVCVFTRDALDWKFGEGTFSDFVFGTFTLILALFLIGISMYFADESLECSHQTGKCTKTVRNIFNQVVSHEEYELSKLSKLVVVERRSRSKTEYDLEATFGETKVSIPTDESVPIEEQKDAIVNFLNNESAPDFRRDDSHRYLTWGGVIALFFAAVLLGSGIYKVVSTRAKSNQASWSATSSEDEEFEFIRANFERGIQNLPVEKNEDKISLLTELFSLSAASMTSQLPHQLSYFEGRPRLSKTERYYLLFESLVYLCFYSDVSAFSHNQSQSARNYLRDVFEECILEPGFYQEDESLESLAVKRLEKYIDSYRNGSATYNPQTVFLNFVALLSQEKSICRHEKLALTGLLEDTVNFMVVAEGMPAYVILMTCLRQLFATERDVTELSAQETADLLMQGIRRARPMNLAKQLNAERSALLAGSTAAN